MAQQATEFFVNEYVVKVESGHPGRVAYHLIATRESWQKLLEELSEALDHAQQDANGQPLRSSNDEILLLTKYATQSRGKTSRVYLMFHEANTLAAHHVRPTFFKNAANTMGCIALILAVAAVLLLARIGLATLLGHSL